MYIPTIITSTLLLALPVFARPTSFLNPLSSTPEIASIFNPTITSPSIAKVLETCSCISTPNPLTPPAFIHFITNTWTPTAVPLNITPRTALTLFSQKKRTTVLVKVLNSGEETAYWAEEEVTGMLLAVRGRWEELGCMVGAEGIGCGEGEGVRVEVVA
ncbi:hypothetical protein EX30DRAFT_373884 [Ascodesmis nigricans]|uniref:Uncharacterized protein n=1 Tax=Ascodesmis nigricans TaxID=341454 RepID=A0A4V6RHC2_9PEZI|nr:hypothetical protein EX30DRAFT_373884 [Ascodesmis nigricans]